MSWIVLRRHDRTYGWSWSLTGDDEATSDWRAARFWGLSGGDLDIPVEAGAREFLQRNQLRWLSEAVEGGFNWDWSWDCGDELTGMKKMQLETEAESGEILGLEQGRSGDEVRRRGFDGPDWWLMQWIRLWRYELRDVWERGRKKVINGQVED